MRSGCSPWIPRSIVKCCALACLHDFFLDLLAHLGHHFLDAGGVDAAVGHQLVERQTCDLAAHGVETAEHYGLGRVVYYDFYARGGFKGADVAALAAYDAAFYLIAVDMEHRHRVFDGCLGGHALYALHHYALGFLIGRELGLVHDVVDISGGGSLGLVAQRFHEFLLGFLAAQAADVLELLAGLRLELVELGAACLESSLAAFEGSACGVHLIACALVFALLLVELQLALLELGVALVGLALAPCGLLLGIGGYLHCLLAAFKLTRALDVVGLALGIGYDLLGARACHAALRGYSHSHSGSSGEHHKGYHCYQIECHMFVYIRWFNNQKKTKRTCLAAERAVYRPVLAVAIDGAQSALWRVRGTY